MTKRLTEDDIAHLHRKAELAAKAADWPSLSELARNWNRRYSQDLLPVLVELKQVREERDQATAALREIQKGWTWRFAQSIFSPDMDDHFRAARAIDIARTALNPPDENSARLES